MTFVAFMGLAFDASYLYFEKRRAQTAADAGAIGGAQELVRGTPANVTTAARKDTSLNRFTHGKWCGCDGEQSAHVGHLTSATQITWKLSSHDPRPTWFMQVLGVSVLYV